MCSKSIYMYMICTILIWGFQLFKKKKSNFNIQSKEILFWLPVFPAL